MYNVRANGVSISKSINWTIEFEFFQGKFDFQPKIFKHNKVFNLQVFGSMRVTLFFNQFLPNRVLFVIQNSKFVFKIYIFFSVFSQKHNVQLLTKCFEQGNAAKVWTKNEGFFQVGHKIHTRNRLILSFLKVKRVVLYTQTTLGQKITLAYRMLASWYIRNIGFHMENRFVVMQPCCIFRARFRIRKAETIKYSLWLAMRWLALVHMLETQRLYNLALSDVFRNLVHACKHNLPHAAWRFLVQFLFLCCQLLRLAKRSLYVTFLWGTSFDLWHSVLSKKS